MRQKFYEYQIDLDISIEQSSSMAEYGSWSYKSSFLSLQWLLANTVPKHADTSVRALEAKEERASKYTKKENLVAIGTQKFEPGDKAYVVLVGFGGGDSFGTSYNDRWEALHIFKRKDLALLVAKDIAFDYACKDIEHHINPKKSKAKVPKLNYLNDNLKNQTFYTSVYQGYFEHLSHVGVYEATLQSPESEADPDTVYDIAFLASEFSLYQSYDWNTLENRAKILKQQNEIKALREKVLLADKMPVASVHFAYKKAKKIRKI